MIKRRNNFWMLISAVAIGLGAVSLQAALFSEPDTVESLTKKLEELPKSGRSRERASLTSDLATLLYHQGQFQKAAETFEQALQFDASDGMKRHIYRFLGKSYESSTRPDKAIEAYEQAVTYDRRNWRRRRDLGNVYEQTQLYPNAIKAYQKAIHYNNKIASVYLSLARTWRKMGILDDAEQNLLKAEALGERGAELFREFSFVYEGLGRYEDAIKYFRKTLSDSAPLEDWARMVYLGALAKDQEVANEGLNNLRKRAPSPEAVLFYEEFVDLLNRNPTALLRGEVVDPHLKAMVRSVRSQQVAP